MKTLEEMKAEFEALPDSEKIMRLKHALISEMAASEAGLDDPDCWVLGVTD